jgi:hypothetical protein
MKVFEVDRTRNSHEMQQECIQNCGGESRKKDSYEDVDVGGI